jgi:hypothetical protein
MRVAWPTVLPGRGRSDARAATAAGAVCRVNRARRSSGPARTSALAWLMVWVRSARALRLATISARTASTAPSRRFGAPRARPDWAARAALTASSRSSVGEGTRTSPSPRRWTSPYRPERTTSSPSRSPPARPGHGRSEDPRQRALSSPRARPPARTSSRRSTSRTSAARGRATERTTTSPARTGGKHERHQSDRRRAVAGPRAQGLDQFPQTRHPQTAVPGKKRLGRRLVGGLPRTNVHLTNVTAMEKRAIALLTRQESRTGYGGSSNSPTAAEEDVLKARRRRIIMQAGQRSADRPGSPESPGRARGPQILL